MQIHYGRRRFLTVTGQGALTAALAAAELSATGFLLTGCAVTLDDVIAWTNIGAGAVSTALTLLGIAGIACAVCAVAAPVAIAAIHAIAGAIQEWQAAPAADKATAWQKIELAMQTAVDQVKAFFAGVSIPGGGVATTILNIASLILNTLGGFIAKFFPSVSSHLLGAKLGATAIPSAPKVLSSKDFKKEFNAIVTAGGHPELVLR